jgi:hypothetical protein
MPAELIYWAPGSPGLASRPQNYHCSKAWFSHDCSSYCLLETPTPAQVDPKASDAFRAWALLPHRYTQLASGRSLLAHAQVNPRFHALLFCWHHGASLPTEHGGSVLTNKPSHGSALLPYQRVETQLLC